MNRWLTLVALVIVILVVTFWDGISVYLPLAIATAGLLFSGYATWTIGRDKKVDALGNVRGCVDRLYVATHLFEILNNDPAKQYEAYEQIEVVKAKCLEIANAMEEAVSKTSGFMGRSAFVSVRDFVTTLRDLNCIALPMKPQLTSRPSNDDLQNFMKEFGIKWKNAMAQGSVVTDQIGEEIIQYKFRRLIFRLIS